VLRVLLKYSDQVCALCSSSFVSLNLLSMKVRALFRLLSVIAGVLLLLFSLKVGTLFNFLSVLIGALLSDESMVVL